MWLCPCPLRGLPLPAQPPKTDVGAHLDSAHCKEAAPAGTQRHRLAHAPLHCPCLLITLPKRQDSEYVKHPSALNYLPVFRVTVLLVLLGPTDRCEPFIAGNTWDVKF